MRFRSFTVVVAALVAAVSVHAAEKEKTQPKVEPAQGSIVGNLICSKCALNATEKCQTALLLAQNTPSSPSRVRTRDRCRRHAR